MAEITPEDIVIALRQLVEHDECLIAQGKLHHFIEVERARTVLDQIDAELDPEVRFDLGGSIDPPEFPERERR